MKLLGTILKRQHTLLAKRLFLPSVKRNIPKEEIGSTMRPEDLIIQDGIIKGPDFKHEPDPRGIGYKLLASMKQFKNNTAQCVIDTDEVDLQGKFLQRCIRTALNMKSLGITKDHVVCVCSSNHRNTAVPYIASIFVGAKPTSISPQLSVKDVGYLLGLVEPRLIFVDEDGETLVNDVLKSQTLDTTVVAFHKESGKMCFDDFLHPNPEEDQFEAYCPKTLSETVLISFSSGTTGLPKGVCLSHYTVLIRMLPTRYYTTSCNPFGSAIELPVYLCYSNLYWISAVFILLSSSLSGFTRLIGKFRPQEFWRIVSKYKVSMTLMNPCQLMDIINSKKPDNADISSLKIIISAGAPMTSALCRNAKEVLPTAAIFPAYGCTETCGAVLGFDLRNSRDMALMTAKPKSVGLPIIGIWYKVIDLETKDVLGPNQKGELYVKSKAVSHEYYKDKTNTPVDSDGWLPTGDLVYYDDDYCFYVIDRIKQMIKYRGFQIAPITIEEVVVQHPAVKEVAVVGIPLPEGDLITAVVVLEDGFSDSCAVDIRKFVDGKVDDFKRLRGGVKFINKIPVTSSGKVKRLLLKEMITSGKI